MVQTVYYYLDSNTESRHFSNAMKHPSTKYPTNIAVESTKLKSKKNHCIKLQPLNAKVENNIALNTTERKFSHQLNPLPNKPTVFSNQKKPSSKIPVLQRKTVLNSQPKREDGHCDNTLSAADRRQKFHQSRLRAGDVCTNDTAPEIKKQAALHYDVLPWYEGYVVHKVVAPPMHGGNQKGILPPIKALDVSVEAVQKISQPKPKCLQGEITHFPVLCNPRCAKRKKNYTSTVPHLPPILPPPAAPPPSISTSLEKDGNRMNQLVDMKKHEHWNPTKVALNKIVAL